MYYCVYFSYEESAFETDSSEAMKCGQVFDVLETGFHEVMYGNVTASAILSLTEWPVPFYDTYNKKGRGEEE